MSKFSDCNAMFKLLITFALPAAFMIGGWTL